MEQFVESAEHGRPVLIGAASNLSGRIMEKVYFGIGAALYLLFVAWCMVTPHK